MQESPSPGVGSVGLKKPQVAAAPPISTSPKLQKPPEADEKHALKGRKKEGKVKGKTSKFGVVPLSKDSLPAIASSKTGKLSPAEKTSHQEIISESKQLERATTDTYGAAHGGDEELAKMQIQAERPVQSKRNEPLSSVDQTMLTTEPPLSVLKLLKRKGTTSKPGKQNPCPVPLRSCPQAGALSTFRGLKEVVMRKVRPQTEDVSPAKSSSPTSSPDFLAAPVIPQNGTNLSDSPQNRGAYRLSTPYKRYAVAAFLVLVFALIALIAIILMKRAKYMEHRDTTTERVRSEATNSDEARYLPFKGTIEFPNVATNPRLEGDPLFLDSAAKDGPKETNETTQNSPPAIHSLD